MTKASDTLTTGAVEQRVKLQVKELHAVVDLLRDLAQCYDKHAQDFHKLPMQCSISIEASTPLHRTVDVLENTVATMAQAQSTLASELLATVVGPLEAFEKQQHRQTKQLLTEIDEAMTSERQLHQSLVQAIGETDFKRGYSKSTPEDDNQSGDTGTSGIDQLRSMKEQRDRDRSVIKQRLMELDLTDEQQNEVVKGQLRRCFDIFTAYTTRLAEQGAEALASQQSTDSALEPTSEEQALRHCELHIEVTNWMITLFAQLLTVQDAIVRRLHTLVKSHSVHTQSTVFILSSVPPSTTAVASSAEDTTLWEIIQSHQQLLVHLADPISRTLRFSKQKQETIRKELLESMADAHKAVQQARHRASDKEQRLHQLRTQPGTSTGALAESVSLTALGLRTAVSAWTKQLSSPKKMLAKNKSLPLSFDIGGGSASPPSPLRPPTAIATLEKEVAEARLYLQTMEQTEATQRAEMAKTLYNTAVIATKTMELMVNDYVKQVGKAMALLSVATAKNVDRLGAEGNSATAGYAQLARFDDEGLDHKLWLAIDDDRPEKNASETETEDADELDAEIDPAACMVTEPFTEEETVAKTKAVVTVADIRRIVATVVSLVRSVAAKYGPVIQGSFDRSPDQWRLVIMVAVLLSFVRLAVKLASLSSDWSELVALQQENTEAMRALVQLLDR